MFKTIGMWVGTALLVVFVSSIVFDTCIDGPGEFCPSCHAEVKQYIRYQAYKDVPLVVHGYCPKCDTKFICSSAVPPSEL